MGTCKLTFSLYARLVLPMMFLRQAFTISNCLIPTQNRVEMAYASSETQC